MCAYDVRREDLAYLLHTAQSFICLESGRSTIRRAVVCFKAFSVLLSLLLTLDWMVNNYLTSLQIVKPVIFHVVDVVALLVLFEKEFVKIKTFVLH